jgi:hypothetical protein
MMLVLAIGTFTDPSKIAPYAEAEVATIHATRLPGLWRTRINESMERVWP